MRRLRGPCRAKKLLGEQRGKLDEEEGESAKREVGGGLGRE